MEDALILSCDDCTLLYKTIFHSACIRCHADFCSDCSIYPLLANLHMNSGLSDEFMSMKGAFYG